MKKSIIATVLCVAAMQNVYAGSATMDEVRFFDSFHNDAAHSKSVYAEGLVGYISDDNSDAMFFGVQGGAPIAPNIEVGITAGFLSIDYDYNYADGDSGLIDPIIVGKYHLENWENNQITVGVHISLPIGEEDIGQGDADIGIFGAIRHPLNNRTVLMGTAGITSFDHEYDREFSLNLGGGIIYKVDDMLHGIAELTMATEVEQMDLTLGADYAIQKNGSIRGSVDLGLNDGSPDFTMQVGYLHRF